MQRRQKLRIILSALLIRMTYVDCELLRRHAIYLKKMKKNNNRTVCMCVYGCVVEWITLCEYSSIACIVCIVCVFVWKCVCVMYAHYTHRTLPKYNRAWSSPELFFFVFALVNFTACHLSSLLCLAIITSLHFRSNICTICVFLLPLHRFFALRLEASAQLECQVRMNRNAQTNKGESICKR